MDKVKLLAQERYFYTADVELAGYGKVPLVGDQEAVERVLMILGRDANHDLRILPPDE